MSLALNNVRTRLGEQDFNFTLTANAGEVHAILGKSGSGKSTLLNLIGGFLTPSHGTITWADSSLLPLSPNERPVTTLFQSHNLFDHLTVKRNVALGVSANMKITPRGWQDIEEVLEDVGLPNRGQEKPDQLSGGEQQRVGLARCLLSKKPILLLDEPYGALDETTRNEMLAITAEVITKHNLCVLMVTHNPDDAKALSAIENMVTDGCIA